MARVTTGAPARRSPPRRPDAVNTAVLHLLRAIPVGHLDRRLTDIERWVARVEKDLGTLVSDLSRPPLRRAGGNRKPPRPAVHAPRPAPRGARRPAPQVRVTPTRITHLPVERELAHPGG